MVDRFNVNGKIKGTLYFRVIVCRKHIIMIQLRYKYHNAYSLQCHGDNAEYTETKTQHAYAHEHTKEGWVNKSLYALSHGIFLAFSHWKMV